MKRNHSTKDLILLEIFPWMHKIPSMLHGVDSSIAVLKNTEIGAELKAIRDFFLTIQKDFDSFSSSFHLSCPSGCGSCCEHFVPDITSSEALIIASYMLFGDKKEILREKMKDWNPSNLSCPMYDAWNKEHHCMIYEIRPLVCRMFASCPSADKEGNPEYRGCRFNPKSFSLPSEKMNGILVMSHYGRMLENLPGNSVSTKLLPEAVGKSMNRLGIAMNSLFPRETMLLAPPEAS